MAYKLKPSHTESLLPLDVESDSSPIKASRVSESTKRLLNPVLEGRRAALAILAEIEAKHTQPIQPDAHRLVADHAHYLAVSQNAKTVAEREFAESKLAELKRKISLHKSVNESVGRPRVSRDTTAKLWFAHARDREGNTIAYGWHRHTNPSAVSQRLYQNMTADEREAWHSTDTDIEAGETRGGRQIVGNGFVRPRSPKSVTEEYDESDERERMFEFPGANSALRRATRSNPRNIPCPTCKQPNRLTPKDKRLGYQCDECADRDEGGYGY